MTQTRVGTPTPETPQHYNRQLRPGSLKSWIRSPRTLLTYVEAVGQDLQQTKATVDVVLSKAAVDLDAVLRKGMQDHAELRNVVVQIVATHPMVCFAGPAAQQPAQGVSDQRLAGMVLDLAARLARLEGVTF